MLMPTYSLRLGLLLCLSVLTPVVARTDERTQIILPAKQASAKDLAKVMQAQPAGAHLKLAVRPLPSFTRLLSLLPRRTKRAGNKLTLPNGSDYVIVTAMTEAQREAEFRSHTETRQELIERLKQIKGYSPDIIVKVKRPRDKAFVTVGTLEQGIQKVPSLPSGTYTIAIVHYNYSGTKKTETTYQFYRIVGQPTLPQPHQALKPDIRWTVDENGNWEEVPTSTRTGLHWAERADGYWEEVPFPAAHTSHKTVDSKG